MIENIVAEKSVNNYYFRMKGIGEKVQLLRNAMGWSQKKLGEESGGINTETINRIEHDQNTSINKLVNIAKALNVKLGELIPDSELPNKHKDLDASACSIPDHSLLQIMLDEMLHDARYAPWISANVVNLHAGMKGVKADLSLIVNGEAQYPAAFSRPGIDVKKTPKK